MIRDKKTKNQKDLTMTRSIVSARTNRTYKSSSSLATTSSFTLTDGSTSSFTLNDGSTIHTNVSTTTIDPETRINMEGITLVCLNLPFQSIANLFSSFQEINDYIQIFTDPSLCLNWMQSSNDSIFFISSSTDRDFIAAVHAIIVVESIFILNSEAQVSKNDFPKLAGVFKQHEELLTALENTFTWFERGKLELFVFENDKIFLWSQLWKEERMNIKITSNKDELAKMAKNYYCNNMKILKLVDTFCQTYRSNDALRWCFRFPFPARSLNHTLRCRNIEQLGFYSFLLNDVPRVIKQQNRRNSPAQLYKGMKLSSDLLDNLVKHTGELVCTSGYFICTTSRTAAWVLASSPSQRSDLLPVLFNITCDPWVPFGEISTDKTPDQVVFDIYTSFRIMYVSRGQISVVKIKTADEEGRQMAKDYKNNHNGEDIQVLLNELLTTPKSPVSSMEIRSIPASADEIRAQQHLACGEFDLALSTYRRIQPVSPRILNIIGQIYTEKLDDNELALGCHTQALKMQEENGEDISDTLFNLGIVHHNRREFDLALSCHMRAFKLRETIYPENHLLIANSLRGIANAHWARRELPEALEAAQRTLIIHQSLMPINGANVATSWATMANIYHDSGDNTQALELGTRALVLLENCEPANSPTLAALHHNMAAFQLSLGALPEARISFEKALEIYTKILPPEHATRIVIENHIQCIVQLQQEITEQNLNGTRE